jgi:RHS repeat-associated protein
MVEGTNGWFGAQSTNVAVNVSVGAPQANVYFIHTDHLNTPRLVANASGTTVWRWDQQEPFGVSAPDENPSSLGNFEFALRFPGQYADKETNLFYNYFRDYDSTIGRYVESDPIGLEAGLNTYLYASANPVTVVDPFGLDTLVFKGGVLTHYDSKGNATASYPATSGKPGVTDPRIRDVGPIPEGRYTVDPREISPTNFLRRYFDLRDWGEYRVSMHPDPSNNMFGRYGFFIHGGTDPGSSGCIDIGSADKTFFPRLKSVGEPVPVIVVR